MVILKSWDTKKRGPEVKVKKKSYKNVKYVFFFLIFNEN